MIHLLEQVREIAGERAAPSDQLAALDLAIGTVEGTVEGTVDRRVDGTAGGTVDHDSDQVRRPAGLAARQRVELLGMVTRGQLRRAVVLSREHVAHHPEDIVIGVLLEVLVAALAGPSAVAATGDDGCGGALT